MISFKKLKTRLLVFMLAVLVLMIGSVLAVVQVRMRAHVRQDIADALASESVTFRRIDAARSRELQQTGRLVAKLPILLALMSTHDIATIQDGSASILDTSDADLLMLDDAKGQVLAFHAKSEDVPIGPVKRLMQANASDADMDWWLAGGHLFRVAVTPIYAGSGGDAVLLGKITIGHDVTSESLADKSLFGSSRLVMVANGKAVQTSLDPQLVPAFERWLGSNMNSAKPSAEITEVTLGDERFLLHTLALSGAHPVNVYFIRSYDEATSFISALDRLLLVLGFVALALGTGGVFLVSRQITRPVEDLAAGARQMQAGNFDFELHPEGTDEVAELTSTFNDMRLSIKKSRDGMLHAARLEAVGKLAGGVAHDFNNLVTIISGYSDLLLDNADARSKPYIEEIKRAGERATALTRQLLAFSRKQVLEPQVLDANQIVRNMVKMLNVLIGEDVELVTSLGDDLGRVKADPGQLEQVIMNLAVNARDAMPKGGKLIIETQPAELDDAYAAANPEIAPGAYVMLAFTDSGTGMSKETLAHIFEPFFTTKEVGKGTGLGLATVYGIVKQSGGHVTVYSELNQGTTFKVFLPSLDKSLPLARPRIIGDMPRGTGTILLVEDEQSLRVLAAESLKRLGYEVIQASNGLEALALVDQNKSHIDVVLTDVVMPRMGGPEFIAKLAEKRSGFGVIYMSGYTDTSISDKVREQEAVLLNKPFTTEALARKVVEAKQRAAGANA